MSEPEIFSKQPNVVKLDAGDYFWCACGRAETQPFCDGSHKGTGLGPQKFTVEEDKTVALCNCKHTKNPPYCDGSHSAL